MDTNKFQPGNFDDDSIDELQTLFQEHYRIELKPEKEDVLRAKLGEYKQRMNNALSQKNLPSSALDTKVKILILEELLKHKSFGGGDLIVTLADDKQMLELAKTIAPRKNLTPSELIALISLNALDVIKDYNETGGSTVRRGELPAQGLPSPEKN